MSASRNQRLGEQIKVEASHVLAREVHDPGIGFVTLTRVRCQPDLQQARVYYTALGDAAAQRATARALARATPFLRRQIGQRLRLRRVPELALRLRRVDRPPGPHRGAAAGDSRQRRACHTRCPTTQTTATGNAASIARIREAIRSRQRFVITSHARPDGDSIGSQLAMAYALRALGKDVEVVNQDAAPAPLMAFPGVPAIEVAERVDGEFDAAIIMECSDLTRTGVAGLDRYFVINIDHHPGNTDYGAINWFDGSAAACGEMVFDLIRALGVPLSLEIATHVYLAILTDTGSFHYSNISPRTFDICRQPVEAGVDPPQVARSVFDSNTLGRLKLFGAVLSAMELEHDGRLAVVCVDHAMAARPAARYDDTEGLINLPLTVQRDPGGRLLQGDRPARLPRQHALEGRHRRRRGREAVRRRRPQERRPAARVTGRSTRCGRASSPRSRPRSSRAPGRSRRHRRRDDAHRDRSGIDGVLVIDKPAGPTSHDVVAAVRRALGAARIGHTGTLDPLATGVLPLVVGRATRLARFLRGADKTYEAARRVRLARPTPTTRPATPSARRRPTWPSRRRVDARARRVPRARSCSSRRRYSAKKVGGRRAPTRSRAPRRAGELDAGARSTVPRRCDAAGGRRRRVRHAWRRRARPASTCGRWRTTSAQALGHGAHLGGAPADARAASSTLDAGRSRSRP